MVEIVETLVTILREKGIRESAVVVGTGINKTTVHEIYTGLNDNPKVQTIAAIADYAGIRFMWVTEESSRAINTGDITAYREMMAHRDKENDTLLQIMRSQRDALDRKDRIIESLTEQLNEYRAKREN